MPELIVIQNSRPQQGFKIPLMVVIPFVHRLLYHSDAWNGL